MAPTPPADSSAPPGDYDAFVSYSHADEHWVWSWLIPRLKAANLTICIDRESFDIGVPALVNMENAVAASRHTLLILTPAWVESQWTAFEALLAMHTDPIGLLQRTLPVLREPCAPLQRIGMLSYADLTDSADAEQEFAKLLDAIRGVRRLPDANRTLLGSGRTAPHASLPSLHQLRAPVSDFVGREAEIERLVQALNQVGDGGVAAAISGIQGMGGIGKTELAHLVATRLADNFPDAQLLLDLRGASEQPMSPALALATVIRAFEPLAQLPDDPVQLTALYHSVLNGKRVLILADDARDAAQVRPLLPPIGCALLVTSRRRFSLPGMTALALGILSPEEAERLLLAICPRIGEAAPRLAQLCGYLPLALRVSAGLLKDDPMRNIEGYLQALADERVRLTQLRDPEDPALDVEASLNLSYIALESALQAALCQISVFPTSFDHLAATAVVKLAGEPSAAPVQQQDTRWWQRVTRRFGCRSAPIPPQAVDEPAPSAMLKTTLSRLYQRSLLDYDETQERYSLHDLVRAFAAARLNDETPVRLRYARHYVQVAASADNLFLQGREQIAVGLALFDRERVHIGTGWSWARARAGDQVTDELLLSYADATAYIGDLRYHSRRERIPQLEAALLAAQRLARKDAQGRFLGNLGSAYADLGEARRAIEFYEQRLVIAREIGDRRGESAALGNLGIAYKNLGEAQRAIEFYEQALVIDRELGDRRGEGADLGNLGNAYAALGETQRAIEFYEQALLIIREIGDRRGEGNALGNLGNAYADLGEAQRAIAFYEQRLVIAREIGDRRGEAIASWNLGLELEKQGDLARAAEYMQILVDFEQEIGHPDAEQHAARLEAVRQQLRETGDDTSPATSTAPDDESSG